MPASPLADWDRLVAAVAGVDATPLRQRLVDAWLATQPRSPLVSRDEAIIWYAGPGGEVVLRGDMLGERSAALQCLADTSLWFDRRTYAPAARLDYHLLVDGVDRGDPRNPHVVPSGYGPRVELRMPGYAPAERWRPRADVAHGRVELHASVRSALYPSSRDVRVYVPPGYPAAERYACLYFGDGGDYITFAHVPSLLDNLIAVQQLPPCIAVFVSPSAEHGRTVDYDLNADYARFVAEELVPFIDARYATARAPARRVIAGASFGGLIALQIGLEHSAVFGNVAAQSAFVGRRGDALIRRFAAAPRQPLRIHQLVGSYETEVGRWETVAEGDFVRANRELREVLRAAGYSGVYQEYPEGHSWGLWREYLADALIFLLTGMP